MTDYTSAQTALEAAIGGDLVEEYEIRKDGRRVKRGTVESQVKTAALLEGLVNRRANGMFRVAKLQEPTD